MHLRGPGYIIFKDYCPLPVYRSILYTKVAIKLVNTPLAGSTMNIQGFNSVRLWT